MTDNTPNSNNNKHCESETENGESKKTLLLKSVIKQVKSGTPVYKCHLPICFSEARSLLEKLSDFFLTSNLVININQITDPEERFLRICSFFLSSWHKGPKEVKAPFNPILGETFRCLFEHDDCSSEFISEQISHHPPSTAFCVFNRHKRLLLHAYLKPLTKFYGNSFETTIHGTLVGMLVDLAEVYEITYPKYITKGVLIGNLKLELGGRSTIFCDKTGHFAEFEFKSKNALSGKVYRINSNSGEQIYSISGNWDDKVTCINHKTKNEFVLLDVANISTARKIVAPLDQQTCNESQKVWHSVSENILKNQEDKAFECKTAIEEEQRNLRKDPKKVWEPQIFAKTGEDYVYPELKNIFGGNVEHVFLHPERKRRIKIHNGKVKTEAACSSSHSSHITTVQSEHGGSYTSSPVV